MRPIRQYPDVVLGETQVTSETSEAGVHARSLGRTVLDAGRPATATTGTVAAGL